MGEPKTIYAAKSQGKKEERERLEPVVRQAVQRAERAERQAGLVPCAECAFWKRGYEPRVNRVASSSAAWGLCGMSGQGAKLMGMAWFNSNGPDDRIVTQERFGCVLGKSAD